MLPGSALCPKLPPLGTAQPAAEQTQLTIRVALRNSVLGTLQHPWARGCERKQREGGWGVGRGMNIEGAQSMSRGGDHDQEGGARRHELRGKAG